MSKNKILRQFPIFTPFVSVKGEGEVYFSTGKPRAVLVSEPSKTGGKLEKVKAPKKMQMLESCMIEVCHPTKSAHFPAVDGEIFDCAPVVVHASIAIGSDGQVPSVQIDAATWDTDASSHQSIEPDTITLTKRSVRLLVGDGANSKLVVGCGSDKVLVLCESPPSVELVAADDSLTRGYISFAEVNTAYIRVTNNFDVSTIKKRSPADDAAAEPTQRDVEAFKERAKEAFAQTAKPNKRVAGVNKAIKKAEKKAAKIAAKKLTPSKGRVA